MARLFVPAGFDAAAVSPDLYLFLQNEPDDLFVLLEFHSLGRDRRQIDVAVLGPYGVDVVEVKAKVRGAVIASDNGPWHVRRDDGGTEALPLNGAAGENPYDQAARTAEDFRRWLEHGLGVRTQVFPLVLVPLYRRDASLRNRGFVWATNGLSTFKRSLRSLRRYKDAPASLSVEDYRRIVEALELTELTGNAAATPELPNPPYRVSASPETPSPVLPPPVAAAKAEPPPVPAQPPRGGAAAPPFAGFTKQRSLRLFVPGVVALLLTGVVWFATASREAASPALTAAGLSVVPAGSDCPDSHLVKGNVNDEGERIFHVEGQRYYEATNPEECFASAEEAEAGGFRASLR